MTPERLLQLQIKATGRGLFATDCQELFDHIDELRAELAAAKEAVECVEMLGRLPAGTNICTYRGGVTVETLGGFGTVAYSSTTLHAALTAATKGG